MVELMVQISSSLLAKNVCSFTRFLQYPKTDLYQKTPNLNYVICTWRVPSANRVFNCRIWFVKKEKLTPGSMPGQNVSS